MNGLAVRRLLLFINGLPTIGEKCVFCREAPYQDETFNG